MQYITLNNGTTMPSIGPGAHELCGQKGAKIMQNALQIGHRLLDTARMYKNEKELNLQNLGLECVDLPVIHEPYENTKEMYQVCEEVHRKGLTRTVEVLNFYGRYFRGFFRFRLDKGLFPFIERDGNGVRYFTKSDIGWVNCPRSCNMSIKDIKHYINFTAGGIKAAKERKELLERYSETLSKEFEILHIAHKKWK